MKLKWTENEIHTDVAAGGAAASAAAPGFTTVFTVVSRVAAAEAAAPAAATSVWISFSFHLNFISIWFLFGFIMDFYENLDFASPKSRFWKFIVEIKIPYSVSRRFR